MKDFIYKCFLNTTVDDSFEIESEQEKVYRILLDARADLPRPVVGG